MKKEEIHLWDWHRILIGQAPWEFMIEVFFRTVIIYFLLILAMRIMGKRMTAQMSIFELAVIVMLGAIVSYPMQNPDKGIVIGILVLLLTVTLHRLLNLLSFQNRRMEKLTQGRSSIILKNGQLQLNEMKISTIARETLFANLRQNNISQLGELDRVYFETNGDISIFRSANKIPGLSIVPDSDNALKSNGKIKQGYFACISCGKVDKSEDIPKHACDDCGNKHWTKAVE